MKDGTIDAKEHPIYANSHGGQRIERIDQIDNRQQQLTPFTCLNEAD